MVKRKIHVDNDHAEDVKHWIKVFTKRVETYESDSFVGFTMFIFRADNEMTLAILRGLREMIFAKEATFYFEKI